MKIRKHRPQIYYVIHYVMWTFWSKIVFGFQIMHQNQFKMHFEPATLVFECLCQSTNISNGTRIHLCHLLYNWWGVEKLYWHKNPVCKMDTKKHKKNNPSKYILRTCNIGKQSRCLHLVKVQSKTRSWSSTGRGLSLMHTDKQGDFEWYLSGKIHIQGPHA